MMKSGIVRLYPDVRLVSGTPPVHAKEGATTARAGQTEVIGVGPVLNGECQVLDAFAETLRQIVDRFAHERLDVVAIDGLHHFRSYCTAHP